MKWFMIFVMVINLYALDLKQRIEKLTLAPIKNNIVQISYDPFKKGKEIINNTFDKKPQEQTLHITTVLNGKVFANANWHKEGDKVKGYEIIQIRDDSVLAKKSGKIIKFGIKRKKSIVKVEDK